MDTQTQVLIICFLALLTIFSAFFSAAETAYSSVSNSKIILKAKNGKKSAKLIKKHHKSFGWTLSTILICNNIVNVLSASIATYFVSKIVGQSTSSTLISTAIITPIIVVFGEILPKLMAKKYSYGYLTKIVYIMEFLNIMLFLITYPLSKLTLQSKITNSELELKNLINIAKKEGVIDRNEATLTSKALDLDSLKIKEIMTKKNEIISININSTVNDALLIFESTGHSRLLVEEKNEFIGIIILKDIFLLSKNTHIKKFIVPVLYISQYKIASKTLEIMRKNKSHLVIVLEKKASKKVMGIITIEDIIEALVGEIYDEHDVALPIQEIAHYKWQVIGSASILELEKQLKLNLEIEENISTVKQWLQSRINRRIKSDLIYKYKNKITFKIISNKNSEETIIQINKK